MYRNFVIFLALTFSAAACNSPQTAEQPPASSGEQATPAPSGNRGTAEITLGATQVSINYGRPVLQGRDMLSQLQDGAGVACSPLEAGGCSAVCGELHAAAEKVRARKITKFRYIMCLQWLKFYQFVPRLETL